ncbi:MAG TPA: aspartate carbamoyltransferase catalytic subunit [Myxococcaceae bacterium]|nr:aspartate carbamoyltransferase catalytic subunit [Myxococcaceae bacterium]
MTARPRHLLAIRGLQRSEVELLLEAAAAHKRARKAGEVRPVLARKVVANLFFEDSTRTRSSFEIAARALGADVLNWSAKGSSVAKGETLLDTARNIDVMGPAAIVMRHPAAGAAALVARHVRSAIINAGDGTHEHPSQGLLDAFTLREKLGPLDGKQILIVGDILHSRVARSNVLCQRLLGAEVTLCGPPTLVPPELESLGARVTADFDGALEAADAVMMLRIQLERQQQGLFPSPREYSRRYGLNLARAARMKKHAIILHPGPMNRGLEIAHEVADGERNVILDQVENGVAMRMAILERCWA